MADLRGCADAAGLNRREAGWIAAGANNPPPATGSASQIRDMGKVEPVTDALVGRHHAVGREDGLDVTQAEAEAVIQPDHVLDHLARLIHQHGRDSLAGVA